MRKWLHFRACEARETKKIKKDERRARVALEDAFRLDDEANSARTVSSSRVLDRSRSANGAAVTPCFVGAMVLTKKIHLQSVSFPAHTLRDPICPLPFCLALFYDLRVRFSLGFFALRFARLPALLFIASERFFSLLRCCVAVPRRIMLNAKSCSCDNSPSETIHHCLVEFIDHY